MSCFVYARGKKVSDRGAHRRLAIVHGLSPVVPQPWRPNRGKPFVVAKQILLVVLRQLYFPFLQQRLLFYSTTFFTSKIWGLCHYSAIVIYRHLFFTAVCRRRPATKGEAILPRARQMDHLLFGDKSDPDLAPGATAANIMVSFLTPPVSLYF